jgi:hypothetical protein
MPSQKSAYAYITKRVDRKNGQMLAMEDFCQLDGRLTQDKYRGSYERCGKIVSAYSATSGLDLAELFIRIVFSFAVGNSDMRGNAGSAPFVAIFNKQNGRGVAFHILADSTFEIRARREFRQQHGWVKNVTVELGFRERGFNYVLQPGEALKLPKILFYEFESKTDMAAYKLHRYYNEILPARSLPVVYNTWLSRLDNISYDLLSEQLEKAKYI